MQVPLWATQVLWLLGNPRSQSTFCASGWPTSGYKYPGSHQSLVECCLWGIEKWTLKARESPWAKKTNQKKKKNHRLAIEIQWNELKI